MDLGLAGKVVLVTGGGGGAGPSIVEAFAAEGAHVAVHYRSSADRAEAAAAAVRDRGGEAIAIQADLTSRSSIDAAVATVERELGRVGVLVTATSAYRSAKLAETSDEDWLKKSEAAYLKQKTDASGKTRDLLSRNYDIDCGPTGKVTCPVCQGNHVIVKKGPFGDSYKTCTYCNEHGILTCEQYNKLLRGELQKQ